MANVEPGAPEGTPQVHRATLILRRVLETSNEFEIHMQRQLAVNSTDLKAMEHLIASGPMGATDLARRIGVSTAALTSVVDRLVAVGHASRQPHPTDRRGVVIVPSPASVAQAMAHLMPMITGIDAVLDGFDAEEQSVITDYLERVLDVYRAQLT